MIYSYDANAFPFNSPGWTPQNSTCEFDCEELIIDGHLVFIWNQINDAMSYTYIISNDFGQPPPPDTLWVEWRFRSNCLFDDTFAGADAFMNVRYMSIFEQTQMFGDVVLNQSGDFFIIGLDAQAFHTYRFES